MSDTQALYNSRNEATGYTLAADIYTDTRTVVLQEADYSQLACQLGYSYA